jgi:hypothetical protein
MNTNAALAGEAKRCAVCDSGGRQGGNESAASEAVGVLCVMLIES